ncbi:LytR/AlgR family response regulator transcription factor [Pedobacter hartonius]|uniref:Two component transcriptional regulator, LytTR family n=1 Tax=Pedobacter hartonius TaxID=425514 RepID=A0A1H4H5T8_9SPHI|nr:LytTR family DNA-binding domain-containing protein [Pedobacter hartonius]SEB17096.1 two component transcriptional regulator, LytTR family [Pedobacter hartonius]
MNCIVIDDERLARETLSGYIEKIPGLHLNGAFENALEATDLIGSGKIDIIFCDIQMPELDGVSFFKTLKNPPIFIFVTGHSAFAVESFELNVFDYILKPFSITRLLKTVNKIHAADDNKRNGIDKKSLIIKDRSSNVIIPHGEIFFLKSDKDYIKVVTINKEYLVWKKISDMEDGLASTGQFLRVQKSYIVNLNFVKKITGNMIIMNGSIEVIPIGGQYREELYRYFGISIKSR